MKSSLLHGMASLALLFFVGCGKFATSLPIVYSDCAAATRPAQAIYADSGSTSSTLSAGDLDPSIVEMFDSYLGQSSLDVPPSFDGNQTLCTDSMSTLGCALFFFDRAMVTQVTPANLEIQAEAIGNLTIVARATTSGNPGMILLSTYGSGNDSSVGLYIFSGGSINGIKCAQGVDPAPQCPTDIYSSVVSVDLTVTGCSPNVSISVRINDHDVAKLHQEGVSAPDSGRAGLLFGKGPPSSSGGTYRNLLISARS